uniref:Uncharacterized protein n=1 Tax=Anguilla anguilla TaxID=7936 RepID=A0A0E9SEK0_ANGAN
MTQIYATVYNIIAMFVWMGHNFRYYRKEHNHITTHSPSTPPYTRR